MLKMLALVVGRVLRLNVAHHEVFSHTRNLSRPACCIVGHTRAHASTHRPRTGNNSRIRALGDINRHIQAKKMAAVLE